MLLWFTDLMNVTEEVTIHRPNVSTLLSSAFIRGDLNAVTETCDVYTYIRYKKITPLVTAGCWSLSGAKGLTMLNLFIFNCDLL